MRFACGFISAMMSWNDIVRVLITMFPVGPSFCRLSPHERAAAKFTGSAVGTTIVRVKDALAGPPWLVTNFDVL